MAMLWKYHNLRENRTPVVNEPVGPTRNELEAALNEEAAAPVEESVPAPAKPSRGRNPRTQVPVQGEANPTADAPETA